MVARRCHLHGLAIVFFCKIDSHRIDCKHHSIFTANHTANHAANHTLGKNLNMDVHFSLAEVVINIINTTRLQPLWDCVSHNAFASVDESSRSAYPCPTQRGELVYRLTALAIYGESGDAMNYFQSVFPQVNHFGEGAYDTCSSAAYDVLADVSECVFNQVVDLEPRRLVKLAAWINQAA